MMHKTLSRALAAAAVIGAPAVANASHAPAIHDCQKSARAIIAAVSETGQTQLAQNRGHCRSWRARIRSAKARYRAQCLSSPIRSRGRWQICSNWNRTLNAEIARYNAACARRG